MRFYPLTLAFGALAFGATLGLPPVSAPAGADEVFTGEVLVAPPPANWTGGTPKTTDAGVRREWRRNFLTGDGVVERIVIVRSGAGKDRAAQLAAQNMAKAITRDCAKPTVSEIVTTRAQIGTVASFTAQCARIKDTVAGASLFAMGKVYAGDFYTYAVQRTWRGHKDNPGSPANSPKTGEQWATYFARIAVCNTLSTPCDPAHAEMIHADPRFKTMRALPVSTRPVIASDDAIKVGRKLGNLTGRAEACGEDVEPLTSKIDRMFAHITANDQDSSKAIRAFNTARGKGKAEQDAKSKASCGEVLRDFRQHPSRVGAFYRYIEQFI